MGAAICLRLSMVTNHVAQSARSSCAHGDTLHSIQVIPGQGRPNLGGNDASCVMDILRGKKKFCGLLYCIVNSVMFVS